MGTWSKIEGFLSKAGSAISEGLQLTSQFIPVLRPFVGSGAPQQILNDVASVAAKGTNDLTVIGSTIIQVEGAMKGLTGPQKLQSAATLVTPILESSEFLMGTEVGDEAEFNAGVQDLVNATVRIYNARKPTINLKSTGVVSTPAAALATPTPAVPPSTTDAASAKP